MAELTKYCRKCGRQLNINAKFCKFCGASLSVPAASQPSYQQAPAQQTSFRQSPYQQASAQQASYRQPPYQQAPAQQPPYQQAAAQQAIRKVSEIIMAAADQPGEFDYGELDIRGIIGGIAGTAGSFVTEKAPGMQQLSSIGKLAGNVGGSSKGKPKIIFLLILLAVLWIADVLLTSFGVMPEVGSYFITGLRAGAIIRVAFGVISSALRKKPA